MPRKLNTACNQLLILTIAQFEGLDAAQRYLANRATEIPLLLLIPFDSPGLKYFFQSDCKLFEARFFEMLVLKQNR